MILGIAGFDLDSRLREGWTQRIELLTDADPAKHVEPLRSLRGGR